MRKLITVSLMALFCITVSATCAPQQTDKSKLRILYVGGASDWEARHGGDNVKERMAAFEKMLNSYFATVKVIHADDYTQRMSYDYDVTVMDGKPKQISPELMDQERGIWFKPGYFTEDFDKPILTIGQLSDELGRRVGTKNDWYCLCLDSDAHSWREDHPIFKGPFPVTMTVVNKPTPEEAFHNVNLGETIPKEIPMWSVQTKGYVTEEGFAVGLVSRHWGYEDSPEAEFISGGVSSKALGAVAIGRHGNWFHWGFAASPIYMTEEAQTVLANAIVYISQFDGQGIIARKYSDRIATRNNIEELKMMASQQGYDHMVEMQDIANKMIEEMAEKARAKQDRGEELTEEEKMYAAMKARPMPPRETMLQMYMPTYFPMFGTDEQAYFKYFDENRDYFFDGSGTYNLVVDEDAKSLGIANNDIRLLDEAIKMLETQRETEKARRILTRYTLVNFDTAKEWREWFDTNRGNMFFTEAGGWIWLIDSREPGVNDYRVWEARRALTTVEPGQTSDNSPVAVAADIATLQTGEKAVYIKISVHPGYHIYDFVSSKDAYIPVKIDIDLPEGYEKLGDLQKSASRVYNTKGTTIWDGTVIFTQVIAGSGSGTVECTVEYQSCAHDICFPPAAAKFSLEIK